MFNLIATTYRFREEDAYDELLDLLEDFGDPNAEAEITNVKGLIIANTRLDPFYVVEKLKSAVSEPWKVRYLLRVIPVETVVPAVLEDIRLATIKLSSKIPEDKSFRITIEKRHSQLHSSELIDVIADEVKRKVDLDNPDWIVMVQILGSEAGVSVFEPDKIFSSEIEKRKMGD